MIRVVTIVAVVVLAAAAIVIAGDEVHGHLSDMERWLAGLGAWGPAVFIVAFVLLTSLLVPDTVMSIAAGVLFGLAGGTAAAAAGGLLASVVQWALGRGALRERVERLAARRPRLAAFHRAVRQDSVRLQFLIRLTPLSPALASYLLGAAGVRLGGFMLASLGLLPGFFLEVYLGYAGRHVASMAGRPALSIVVHDVAVVAGLSAVVVVMTIISRLARRAIAEAAERPAGGAEAPVGA